jgi:predicted secreted protein
VSVLTCARPRRRTGALLLGSTLCALMIRCDAPGTDPGAPIKNQTGRKLIWTTIISAVIFALAMMTYGYLNIEGCRS